MGGLLLPVIPTSWRSQPQSAQQQQLYVKPVKHPAQPLHHPPLPALPCVTDHRASEEPPYPLNQAGSSSRQQRAQQLPLMSPAAAVG